MSDDKLMGALAHMRTMDRVLQVFRVPNPAAGAQWTFTMPGEVIGHVRGISAKLTTSAVVANRTVGITVDDQASIVASSVTTAATAASLATTYTWNDEYAPGIATIVGGVSSIALPSLVLPGGYRITSVASGFDVADQWSNVTLWVETLLSQPMGAHEYRDALELFERIVTSPFLSGRDQ